MLSPIDTSCVNYMPPKRTDSSVPFQIVTRSSTSSAATPLTPARVVVPTTQVSSPSLRGRASRLTYNLPVLVTAALRVPEIGPERGGKKKMESGQKW